MYQARIAAYDDAGPMLNSYIHLNEVAVDQARVLGGNAVRLWPSLGANASP